MPGDVFSIALDAPDPDGDVVTYSVRHDGNLPNTRLEGATLTFSPTPDQLGTYRLTVIARDGVLATEQELTVNVVADPVTTTRLSGRVMDSEKLHAMAEDAYLLALQEATRQYDAQALHRRNIAEGLTQQATPQRAPKRTRRSKRRRRRR